MSTESEEEGFDYSGQLLFNEICRVSENSWSLENASTAESKLLEELPNYQPGSRFDPGSGYRQLFIREYARSSKIQPKTAKFLQNLASIEYCYEDFEEQTVSLNGGREDVFLANERTSDVFWNLDDYMVFRGSKTDASQAQSILSSGAGNIFDLHPIEFDGDFLLWIFERAHRSNADLSQRLSISRLTNAEIEGAADSFGGEATVKHSSNIRRSEAILIGLLKGKNFSMLEGDFTLFPNTSDSATLRTEIEREKVQIKATKAGLRDASKIEKLGLSVQMAVEVGRLYDYWANLDVSEKYVSPEFIVTLIETCRRRDITLDRQPIAVLERQAEKRGEQLGDYDLKLGAQ